MKLDGALKISKFSLKDFNLFILNECVKVAQTGNCKRRKVGAILTVDPLKISEYYEDGLCDIDYRDTIVSIGANKCLELDKSCEEHECLMIDGHCERTIHAEINCIENSMVLSLENKWLYITTAPCIKCFQFLVNKKVKTVWFGDDNYWDMNPIYKQYIMTMAEKYGIKMGKIEK